MAGGEVRVRDVVRIPLVIDGKNNIQVDEYEVQDALGHFMDPAELKGVSTRLNTAMREQILRLFALEVASIVVGVLGACCALFVLLPFHSTRHWSAPVAGACMGFGLVGFIVYKVMRNRLYYTTLPVVLAEHITELNVMYSGRGLRFGLEKTSEYNAPFDLVIQLPTTHTLHAAYVAPQRQSSSTSPLGTEAEEAPAPPSPKSSDKEEPPKEEEGKESQTNSAVL